jgi:hypothetical protein
VDAGVDPRRHVSAALDFIGLPSTEDFERQFVDYSFVSGRGQGFWRDLDATSLPRTRGRSH